MSGYTVQLRTIIEHYSQDQPHLSLEERIEIGRKEFFNFSYPFFDEKFKKAFETNFIKYFYFHEIGQETEGLFKLRLDTWLNINMFYYNKLFESEQLKYDPMENVNLLRQRKRNNNVVETDISTRKGNINSSSESSSKSSEKQDSRQSEKQDHKQTDKGFIRDIQADTPENRLQLTSNADGSGTIEYASNIGENKTTGNSESTDERKGESSGERSGLSSGQSDASSNMTNDENRDRNLSECESENDLQSGKIGGLTYQEMILKYRETFINVERKLFENIRRDGLFMLVYS